jgi:hypothetical protein
VVHLRQRTAADRVWIHPGEELFGRTPKVLGDDATRYLERLGRHHVDQAKQLVAVLLRDEIGS